jgi:putative transcriptional regulator
MNNQIKVFRAKFDMTQEDLAARIGVVRQTILSIENGKYVPSLELAFRIARVFGAGIEEVFQYEEKKGKKRQAAGGRPPG